MRTRSDDDNANLSTDLTTLRAARASVRIDAAARNAAMKGFHARSARAFVCALPAKGTSSVSKSKIALNDFMYAPSKSK